MTAVRGNEDEFRSGDNFSNPHTLVGVGAVGAEGGADAVHTYPLPLPCRAAASSQQLQLKLEVLLLALQRLQLVLALPVGLFKFLLRKKRDKGLPIIPGTRTSVHSVQ